MTESESGSYCARHPTLPAVLPLCFQGVGPHIQATRMLRLTFLCSGDIRCSWLRSLRLLKAVGAVVVLLLSGVAAKAPRAAAMARRRANLDPDDIQDATPRREPITKAGNKSPYTVLGQTHVLLPPRQKAIAPPARRRGTALNFTARAPQTAIATICTG